jgi:hypothetical protein
MPAGFPGPGLKVSLPKSAVPRQAQLMLRVPCGVQSIGAEAETGVDRQKVDKSTKVDWQK